MNLSYKLSSSEKMVTDGFEGGTVVACVILGLSFLVGTPGNLLVIWTILRQIMQRSHTVVLMLHLAVADLLVLITLPLWIYSLVYSWVLGEALCKTLVYIVSVCMFSSIFFITLLSIERFLAICHPFLMMRWKTKSAMNRCLIFLWILALLLGAISLLTHPMDASDGTEQCFIKEFSSSTQAIILLSLETILGFVVPFITLSVCYCLVVAQLRKMRFNSKQKSMRLVHSVVIAFILCWLPHHVINLIDLYCILRPDTEHDCVAQGVVFTSGALVFISSSVNPVLYAFFARNLQGSFEESRLVRLFQEMASHTQRLMELVVQHQTGQRAANTQIELMSAPV
ncbi:leukotriene B4 receptor 1-like [Notolabrus celidotus]|uniref:leukotriene B4 receptor 1-like n=1 Tax=Notolabrus celidotus TaxID=1203425 RepID=UPI0014902539|nr:leukotriene B4 receptor 1-like [Notolabrus celidotus]